MSQESIYFGVTNLRSKHDVKKIKRELDTFPGVLSVSVSTENRRVGVDYDSTGVTKSQLELCLSDMGYNIM
jgi:copper chaperone CopZ